MKVYTGCAVSWGCFKLCKCSAIYTFKLLTNLYIYMYSWLKHLKSCFHVVPCHAYTLLPKWRINTDDEAEKESDNKAQWYLRLRREGRNQLMVSQEQMPFMFLVMLHPLPQMKDLKQHTIAGITNTEWLVPFQWFKSSFSIWWLANHQCGQKKSVIAAYQPSLDQSTTVRKTDTYVLLLSG